MAHEQQRTFSEVELNFVNIAASHGIKKDDVMFLTTPACEEIFLMVREQLAAWQPDRYVDVKYPDGPWASFKERYFPNWLKKISPVRFVEKRYEAVKVLRGFPIPLNDKVTQVDGFLEVPNEE